jgi:hypothetical protein
MTDCRSCHQLSFDGREAHAESVTGKPYAQVLREQIFEPL